MGTKTNENAQHENASSGKNRTRVFEVVTREATAFTSISNRDTDFEV